MCQQRKLLTEVFEEYLRKNQRLKWATRDSAARAWNKLIKAVGDMEISGFNHNEAEDFQEYLFNEGLAPGAVRSNMKMVRPVMNWAKRRGYRQGDPFEGLRLPRVPKREIRVYSDAELCVMLASATVLWQARIITAASAGLRKGEVLNLTVDDVDFDKGYIKVQAKRETQHTWRWSPKSYECRQVPLSEQLNNLLVKIMVELPDGQPYLMLSEQRYWGIQHLRQTGNMPERVKNTPDENFRPFRHILDRAEIRNGCFHDLRKTAITCWLLAGLAPQEVQKLAGHADIQTTMDYYAACRSDIVYRARLEIGATGLEPATS
jgi:integrase